MGMFFMPISSYACGGCSEKQTSKKEIGSKPENNNCCDSGSNSKTKNHKGCGGKCGRSKCTCPSVINAFTFTSEFNLKNITINFSFDKEKYFNAKTFISKGFYSLWLIPKIS